MKKYMIEFEGKPYQAVEITIPDEKGCDTMVFAEDSLYYALYGEPDSDYPKNELARQIMEDMEYFTSSAHTANTESGFLNALCEEYDYYKSIFNDNIVRRCSVCGKVMQKGFTDEEDFYACSDKCLEKAYAGSGGMTQYNQDYEDGYCYYTEWDSPFYGA